MLKKLLLIGLILICSLTPVTAFADEPGSTADTDQDGKLDSEDNCDSTPNTDQLDSNNNGIGDACDESTLDDDDDEISNGNDNCRTVANPNQTDIDGNGIGDACDEDYQRTYLESLRQAANARIQQLQNRNQARGRSSEALSSFGACVEDPNQLTGNSNRFCTQEVSDDNEKFAKLAEAYRNRLIVTVLEEPISTENIYNRALICSSNYIKDSRGFLQFTDGEQIDTAVDFDSPKVNEETDDILDQMDPENATNSTRKVAIEATDCRTAYVEQCVPQNRFTREVSLSDPLPTIVSCSTVQLIFANSGVDLLKQYIGLIYRWAAGILGVFCVLVIMVNGLLISTAQSDDSVVADAKARIFQSISALLLLFFAGIILYTVNPNFFTTEDMIYTTEDNTAEPGAETETPAASDSADSAPSGDATNE